MLWFALIFSAIKKYFEASAPKADIDEETHKTRERIKVDGERIKFDWHYAKGKGKNVIWALHGLGSDETWFVSPDKFATKKHLALIGTKEFPEGLLDDQYPHIISISFGWKWMLSPKEKGDGEKDAEIKYFLGIMDFLIEKLLDKDTEYRHVALGVSMGGFNALQLWLHEPARFHGVAVSNPALKLPGSEKKMPIDLLAKWEFDRHEFEDVSPNYPKNLELVTKDHPPLLILSARYDEFGFFEPAKQYWEDLKAKGANVRFDVALGGHHDLSEVVLAGFINEIFAQEPETIAIPSPHETQPESQTDQG